MFVVQFYVEQVDGVEVDVDCVWGIVGIEFEDEVLCLFVYQVFVGIVVVEIVVEVIVV